MKQEFNKKLSLFLQDNMPLMVLIFLIIIFSVMTPNFLSSRNLSAIMFQSMVTGFLALGQLLVIITGGIDLSQGALVAMNSVIVSVVMQNTGVVPAVICGILITTLIGVLSGSMIAKTSMPPFIVTLGTMGIARGLALMFANAKPVPITNEAFKLLGSGKIAWVPYATILLIIAAVSVNYFLRKRRIGTYIYATGSNENSTKLSGINVARVKLLVYALSAFFCSVGGMIWSARLVSGSPVGGYDYEAESIAAVVVGGASLAGGKGTVLGTIVGVFIFQCINSALNLLGVNTFWQGACKGFLIILAVIIGILRSRQQN